MKEKPLLVFLSTPPTLKNKWPSNVFLCNLPSLSKFSLKESGGRWAKPLTTVAAFHYRTANSIRHRRAPCWLQIIFGSAVFAVSLIRHAS